MADTLKERILRHITNNGPLPFAEYMHWCMADRSDGYYQGKDAIGPEADFITAPEISQMFGELIAIWAIETWNQLGKPTPFNLVELGPGRGTLMTDLLRAAKLSPDFTAGARVCLVETSDHLKTIQRDQLAEHLGIEWHNEFANIPDAPSIIIANEFLDVLPARQYVKSGSGWCERCVAINNGGDLSWVLGNRLREVDALPPGHEYEPDGAVYEISPAREAFAAMIAERLRAVSGAALFIDYGFSTPGFGDTLQALKAHQYRDPLDEPGMCDLTTHVDFHAIGNACAIEKLNCQPLLTQGEFLLALGLLERAGQLGNGKDGETQARITRQAERLALPDQMGDLFKVFCCSTTPHIWPFDKQT